jgi:hypothetical protein
MTEVLDPAGAIPNKHAGVPSEKVSCLPFEAETAMTSSFMGTEIVGEEKVKSMVVELFAKEQGT